MGEINEWNLHIFKNLNFASHFCNYLFGLDSRRRIVGGTEAGFGAFPWQAMIRVGSTRCGGALIGRQHVVTAGSPFIFYHILPF